MQILESSELGLRSARVTLRSPLSPVEVTLFPMVHLGKPDFYREVYADALSHDLVLVEGVNSPASRRITRSYRWIEGSKRIGLSVQYRPREVKNSRAKIVHADLSGEEFEISWRKVPFRIRMLVYVLAPVFAVHFRWFMSRESLAKKLSMDDLPSRQEILSWNPETAFIDDSLLNDRDRRLVERLSDVLDNHGDVRRLAIVYGAAHMRAVLRELSRRRFYADSSRWLTIFPFEVRAPGQSAAAPT